LRAANNDKPNPEDILRSEGNPTLHQPSAKAGQVNDFPLSVGTDAKDGRNDTGPGIRCGSIINLLRSTRARHGGVNGTSRIQGNHCHSFWQLHGQGLSQSLNCKFGSTVRSQFPLSGSPPTGTDVDNHPLSSLIHGWLKGTNDITCFGRHYALEKSRPPDLPQYRRRMPAS